MEKLTLSVATNGTRITARASQSYERVFAALVVLAGLGACRSGPDGPPPQPAGAVVLSLTGTANGNTYRLRRARFTIALAGPDLVLDSETDPAATLLKTPLPAGNYALNLEAGWALERTDTLQVVEATLVSPSLTSFQIVAASTTNVVYRFVTSGGIVTVGDGTLAIGIDVSVSDGGLGADTGSPTCTISPDSCGPGQRCEAHIEAGNVRNICVSSQPDADSPGGGLGGAGGQLGGRAGSDAGTADAMTDGSHFSDADNTCTDTQWRDPETGSCRACPSPGVSCQSVTASANISTDPLTGNIVLDFGAVGGEFLRAAGVFEQLTCNAIILSTSDGVIVNPFVFVPNAGLCAIRFSLRSDRCGQSAFFTLRVSYDAVQKTASFRPCE